MSKLVNELFIVHENSIRQMDIPAQATLHVPTIVL